MKKSLCWLFQRNCILVPTVNRLTISNEVVQAPKALKLPTMEQSIAITIVYNARDNQNTWRIRRTDVDGFTPVTSESRTVGGSGISAVYTSATPCAPPYKLWNNSIGNIWQNPNPNLRETNELNDSIGRIFTNDPIAPFISSQILRDELSNNSS